LKPFTSPSVEYYSATGSGKLHFGHGVTAIDK